MMKTVRQKPWQKTQLWGLYKTQDGSNHGFKWGSLPRILFLRCKLHCHNIENRKRNAFARFAGEQMAFAAVSGGAFFDRSQLRRAESFYHFIRTALRIAFLEQWLENEALFDELWSQRAYAVEPEERDARTVVAYAHSIHELARFAEREGFEVYRPRAIITSAGTLTADMRTDIRRVFGAAVFNRYGSREFGNMAMSCEQEHGLHVIPTATMIEILRPDGAPAKPGELGEIVVTSLTARAMPMIRYRIGDMGVWAEDDCPCGRPLPVIQQVTGRVSDQFMALDGSYVHGEYFTHIVWAMPALRKFQVVQEKRLRVLFRLVLEDRETYDQNLEEARLTEEARKALGGCEVIFEYPPEIEPNATGKHRFTISHVDRPQSW